MRYYIPTLVNSKDEDIAFQKAQDAIRYFRQDEDSEWYGEEEKEFNAELDACTDLQECAEVLNKYSDTIGNGSWFEVKEEA